METSTDLGSSNSRIPDLSFYLLESALRVLRFSIPSLGLSKKNNLLRRFVPFRATSRSFVYTNDISFPQWKKEVNQSFHHKHKAKYEYNVSRNQQMEHDSLTTNIHAWKAASLHILLSTMTFGTLGEGLGFLIALLSTLSRKHANSCHWEEEQNPAMPKSVSQLSCSVDEATR